MVIDALGRVLHDRTLDEHQQEVNLNLWYTQHWRLHDPFERKHSARLIRIIKQ
jgi:hypothetical protein